MKTIYLIDDSPIILANTSKILQKAGYNVETCESWTKILPLLRKQSPDLILIDVDMPGIQGDEVLTSLKKGYPNVKMIFYSSKSELELEGLVKSRTADGFIKKGDGAKLLRKIKFWLS